MDLKASSPLPSSLFLQWSDPDRSQWNGAIQGYRAGWRRMRYYISYKELERTNPPFVPLLFSRHHHSREAKKTVMVTTTSSSSSALGAYNWTEIERYDATDLQLLLKDLEPHTKYEILLQAYNQFGRGPVAKMEAETEADGENCCCPGCKNQANQRRKVFKKRCIPNLYSLQFRQVHRRESRAKV